MRKFLLAVLVDNKPGVLTHVSGLISRRAFNIESISAGYTEEQDITRITHRDSVENLVRKGQDLEKIVLSHAIESHLKRRILVYKNKTILFS